MNILVFMNSFYSVSHTFVHQQVVGLLKHNNVTLVAHKYENLDLFPTSAKMLTIPVYNNILDKYLTKFYRKIINNNYNLSVGVTNEMELILAKNDIDIVHLHSGTSALTLLPILRKLGIPMIVTFHGIDASPAYLKNKKYKDKLPELFEYAKYIIVVSSHMIETLSIEKWMSKIKIIPCCVDIQLFRSQVLTKKNKSFEIQFIHVGRLTPKKGVPDLIKTFVKLCDSYKNISLKVIGDGIEKDLCMKIANESRFSNKILFEGVKSQQEIRNLVDKADIFILNSRTDDDGDMEGSPVGILEAMSLEKPVISTYHAGIPNVIEHNVNGLLVNERDNESLYNKMKYLVDNKLDRARLGKSARKTVINKFTNEIMISKINECFK